MAVITRSEPIRILILDADLVPALTVARSLVKQDYHVEVASARDKPLASFSRGIASCFQYPDPLLTEKAFLDWLVAHLDVHPCDLIIPVTERTLIPLSSHRHRFAHQRIAMADADALNRVLDKAETFKLAERLGIATPRSVYLSEIGQVEGLGDTLSYPVVVKPARSIAAQEGGYAKRNVSYAADKAALFRQCEQSLLHSPIILQSYFQGMGAGIELIARDGEMLYSFQHIRLHEVPLTGGGSSFRVSAELEPVLLQASRKLIRALRWTGVAMVEFKWNPDSGSFCLMEINGRLWGSLPLAVAAGADFPAMLAALYLTGTVSEYPAYRRGIYCRNLSADLMWHEMVLREYLRGSRSEIPSVRWVARDLARVFSPRHHFDAQSWRDPVPGLVEIWRLVVGYSGRVKELLAAKRFGVHQRLLWHNGTVREATRAAKTVLFICYGNINRSALAEAVMKSMLPSGCDKTVLSAGFHGEELRLADPRMASIASEQGIDLSVGRSRCVTDTLIKDSDVIFVMEKRHYDALCAREPSASSKTYLLGPALQNREASEVEIPDPYNQGEDVYRACFNKIHGAVVRLSEGLKLNHGR